VLRTIDFQTIEEYGQKGRTVDIYKIFAFQLGQFLGLVNGKEFYTKSSVASAFPGLKPHLYRNEGLTFHGLLPFLEEFLDIVSRYDVVEGENFVFFTDFDRKVDLAKERYV
jgi:hypothetical protein